MTKNYSEFLEYLEIGARRTPFSEGLLTCEDVANDLGIAEGQVAKSMVVMWADGRPIIAVLPGSRQLSLKKLRELIGATKKEIRLADTREISERLGLTVGAVTPLIKIDHDEVQVVMDSALLEFDEVNISSGDPTLGISIDPKKLQSLLDAQIGDLGRD